MKDDKKKIEINSEVEEKNKNVSDEEILSKDELDAVAGGEINPDCGTAALITPPFLKPVSQKEKKGQVWEIIDGK